MKNYLAINQSLWNARVGTHLKSDFYNVAQWKQGASSLTEIELPLLGRLQEQRLLHLQCHFGQDTLSLARMGAKVTGLDFSDQAIATARALSQELQVPAEFICGDVYQTRALYQGKADIIFSSYGTIGWLPELTTWANNIAACLRPGGRFVFVEFHPFIWAFDNAFSKIEYSYFNVDAIVENLSGSYADKQADLEGECISWNHSLGEVFAAVHQAGLKIQHFQEYNFSPFPIFERNTKIAEQRWAPEGLEGKVPLVYSLVVEKL